jgi:ABC-type transporter MlaC component
VLRIIQHEMLKKRQPETSRTQISVQVMQRVDQESLVQAFLGQFHKSLTAAQMEMLLSKVGRSNI